MKDEMIEAFGKVIKQVSGHQYIVKLEGIDHELLCQRAGRLSRFKISISVGDKVRLELSPYSTEHGRIVFRL